MTDAWVRTSLFIHDILSANSIAEELLIDFHELIGAHTGENMAQAVWATLGKYGLKGRVRVNHIRCSFPV